MIKSDFSFSDNNSFSWLSRMRGFEGQVGPTRILTVIIRLFLFFANLLLNAVSRSLFLPTQMRINLVKNGVLGSRANLRRWFLRLALWWFNNLTRSHLIQSVTQIYFTIAWREWILFSGREGSVFRFGCRCGSFVISSVVVTAVLVLSTIAVGFWRLLVISVTSFFIRSWSFLFVLVAMSVSFTRPGPIVPSFLWIVAMVASVSFPISFVSFLRSWSRPMISVPSVRPVSIVVRPIKVHLAHSTGPIFGSSILLSPLPTSFPLLNRILLLLPLFIFPQSFLSVVLRSLDFLNILILLECICPQSFCFHESV